MSSEWRARADGKRHLNLGDLHEVVQARRATAMAKVIETHPLGVEAGRDEPERLALPIGGCRRDCADALELWAIVPPDRRDAQPSPGLTAPIVGIAGKSALDRQGCALNIR